MRLNSFVSWKHHLALLCVMTLVACGGGGGGGEDVGTQSDPTPQLSINLVEVSEDQFSATITWMTDRAATDVVQYGETTGYGLEVANDTPATSHRIELTGLTEGTTYHFNIRSTDPDGNYQDDVYQDSFTTRTDQAPDRASITTDDFDTFNADLWTFYDPVGLSSYVVSGGTLQLSLPAGTAHDAWEPNNYAVRMMQTVKDENFELTVKFDSPVSAAFQDQGIMIEESGCNWLRFDVYFNDKDEVKAYAARIFDANDDNVADIIAEADAKLNPQPAIGYQPYYLRVTREDPTWTFEYSLDGTDGSWVEITSFDHSMTVNTVGPYAGNYSLNSTVPVPAHTAIVDSFTAVVLP